MKLQSLDQAKEQARRWQRSSQKTGRRLARAKALLAETEQFLHQLPDRQCPSHLLERIRLFLHREQPIQGTEAL